MRVIGTFEVLSGSEEAIREAEGEPRLAHASGTQRFSGGIESDGAIDWLMCYLPGGGARFVGLQRITGSVGARTGSFVMEAIGDHDGRQSTARWRIIAGSGSGELTGITGTGSFHAPGGRTASYELEFELGESANGV